MEYGLNKVQNLNGDREQLFSSLIYNFLVCVNVCVYVFVYFIHVSIFTLTKVLFKFIKFIICFILILSLLILLKTPGNLQKIQKNRILK